MDLVNRLPFKLEKGKKLERAFERLDDQESLLLRSPPGSGKTAVAMAYLLSKAENGTCGVIFFRTKAEINQGLTLLNEMVDEESDPPLIAPLVGKMEACLYPPAEEEKLRWWCNLSACGRREDRWVAGLEAEIQELVGAGLSIERYIEETRKQGVCPFHALRNLAERTDILLTTYPFLYDVELYKYVGERDVLILDEAHTMLVLVTGEMERDRFERERALCEECDETEIDMTPHQYALSLFTGGKKEEYY